MANKKKDTKKDGEPKLNPTEGVTSTHELDDKTKEALVDMLKKVAESEGLTNNSEEYKAVKIEKQQKLSELSNVELVELYEINKLLYDEFNNYVAIDQRDFVHKSMMAKTVSMRKKLLDEMWNRIEKYNTEECDA